MASLHLSRSGFICEPTPLDRVCLTGSCFSCGQSSVLTIWCSFGVFAHFFAYIFFDYIFVPAKQISFRNSACEPTSLVRVLLQVLAVSSHLSLSVFNCGKSPLAKFLLQVWAVSSSDLRCGQLVYLPGLRSQVWSQQGF